MKKIMILLMMALPLFANEIDDLYLGDDDEITSETPWELSLSGLYYQEPDYANSNTLALSYDWNYTIYSFNLNTKVEAALSAYYFEDQIEYFSEPALYLTFENSWSQTYASLWGSSDLADNNQWGYYLSTLVHLIKWDQGKVDLGTFFESSEAYGDFVGGFLYVNHLWNLAPFYHGPSLNLRASMDLNDDLYMTNMSKKSKENSSIASWSNSSIDMAYRVAWYSENQLWGINTELGYLMTVDSFKSSKREPSESLSLDEIWAEATLSRWF